MRNFYLYSLSLAGLLFSSTTTYALSVPSYEAADNTFPQLQQIVKDSGVEMGQFQTCMRNGSWVESIQQSINEGKTALIPGVPETLIFTDSSLVYRISGADRAALETLLSELKNKQTPSIPPVLLAPTVNIPDNSVEPGWGDANAPIHLAVYVDLSCKYCRDLDKILLDLEEKYTGFIQITYRDYPLIDLHPQSFLLAHSAQCALDQDRYWDYLEQLFRWTPRTSQFNTKGLATPDLPATYTLMENEPGEQSLTAFNWFTGKYVTVIENLQNTFPELADEGVLLEVLAEPISPPSARKYVFFKSGNPFYKTQPKSNFYKLDLSTGSIVKMKLSALLPTKINDLQLSTTETKLAWISEDKAGNARHLYVFDLLTDTRTLVKTLPVGQVFEKTDLEWLDEKTIGYKIYNQHSQAFIRSGIIKVK